MLAGPSQHRDSALPWTALPKRIRKEYSAQLHPRIQSPSFARPPRLSRYIDTSRILVVITLEQTIKQAKGEGQRKERTMYGTSVGTRRFHPSVAVVPRQCRPETE